MPRSTRVPTPRQVTVDETAGDEVTFGSRTTGRALASRKLINCSSSTSARKLASPAPGSGIGLFVCRQLVAAMGGRMWAKSRETGGAEFGFSLPLWVEEPLEEASGAPRSSRSAAMEAVGRQATDRLTYSSSTPPDENARVATSLNFSGSWRDPNIGLSLAERRRHDEEPKSSIRPASLSVANRSAPPPSLIGGPSTRPHRPNRPR